MLSSTALGVPRFSITNERCSSSTRRNSLPKPLRALSADTTIVLLLLRVCMETLQFNYPKCTVHSQVSQAQLRFRRSETLFPYGPAAPPFRRTSIVNLLIF